MGGSQLDVHDLRLISRVCHAAILCLVILHHLPSAVASFEAEEEAAEDGKMVQLSNSGHLLSKSGKTRFIRAAVLPLGHRYIGLGKRLEVGTEEGVDQEKRPYSLKDGAAMRYIGLGKRGPRITDSGLRFIGLGKRNPSAMRFIGLGKRMANYEEEEPEEEEQVSLEEIKNLDGSDDYYRSPSKNIEKRSIDDKPTANRDHKLRI